MKRTLIALALAAILPISAQASDKLSYSYVEANYSNLDGDFDGWGLRGSVAMRKVAKLRNCLSRILASNQCPLKISRA